MKRKVRVKSLPKAQMGVNNIPSQGIKPYDIYPPLGSMPKAITPYMMDLGMPTQQQWEKQNGKLNITGDFFKRKKDFGIPTYDPSIPGSRMSQDIRNQEQTLREGEVASTTPPSISAAQDISNYFKSSTDVNGQNKKGNQFLAPALLAATDVFSSVARKFQNRDAKRDLKDQFLSDNLFNPRPEDYSGNRGDYTRNTPGFGDYFRPDEHINGDFNKIAQMGGEMKRKIKITSLPQAAYGGTQNTKAVNQLYGNSSYMTSMFNGTNKDESEEQYNQTLNADPRSTAVLEAEKGETLVRKGTNDVIPQFFKIGGKRHSEGGTPLSGEKATPDSFIYSDTKAMKIKDPAILESFGFAAKKGGYTPAKISKKFDLNSKELREGLYSQNDSLRKRTSVLMADNYISNLGKLALVQESQKGFPQGVPQIAMPYMDKVGLDPAQFLPPSPQEGMTMAMYGGIPKAQIGKSVLSNNAPEKQSLGQGMTPSPYYRENNFGPTAGIAIGPDGKPIQLRSDIYNWDARYNISNMPNNRPVDSSKVLKIDWDLLDDPSFQGYNSVQQNVVTQKPRPAAQTPKPKVNVTKPKPKVSEWGDYEYGGNIPQYQTAGETPQEVAKPNPYAKVFIEERTSTISGKKAYLYYEGDQKYLTDENGDEIPGTRKTRTADDVKFTQYGSPEIANSIDERIKKGNKVIYTRIPAGQFSNQPRLKNTGIYLPSADANSRTEGTLSSAEWKDLQDRHGDWIEKEYPGGGGFNKFKQDLETVDNDPDRLKNLETVGNKAAGWFQDKVNEKSIKATGKPYFKPKDPNSKDPYQRDIKFGRVTYSVPNYFDEPITPDGDIIYWCTPGVNGEAGIAGQGKREEAPANSKFYTSAGIRDASCEPPPPPPPIIPRRPIGFYPQDVLNTAAAVGDLASINKYNPRMVQFNAQPMKPTYYDPNRELANNAEMVNIATQNLAQFTGPQAFNSRFSEVQGKGLANAANIESRYNNLNVGVANQFEQANKQMTNEIDFRNQLAANDFYDKTVIANQQFDNSKRLGRRQVVDYTNAALDNRFITDQMNSLYPNYFVDPAMLKTYYNQTQQLPAKQKGQDLATYLKSAGIDITNPTVQAAMAKSLLGDVDVDERGNIMAATAATNNRRRGKKS